MPKRKTEVPGTIERSDKHAQQLWTKAHDSAVETYGEGASAHRVAYAALKHEYEKKGDRWVAKGPSDPQAAQGTRAKTEAVQQKKVRAKGKKVRTA